jgi:peptide/nickel transport system permease protein
MAGYVLRRLASGLLMLFAITIVTFALFRLIPLPTGCLLYPCGPGTTTTDAQLAEAEHRLGTDQSVPEQYASFIWRIVRHGSFGASWVHGPIDPQLRAAIPPTVSVLVGGILLLLLLAIPLGVLSALHADQRLDRIILSATVVGIALHPFILGLLLTKLFSSNLHATPRGGYCNLLSTPPAMQPLPGYPAPPPPCGGPVDWAHHMILPWLTFALIFLPLYTRMIRGRVIETLAAQHVMAARAKGAPAVRVFRWHVLRPALLPLVTMIGLDLGGAIMAAIYVESIYFLGGVGSLMLRSIAGPGVQFGYDLPLIAALFFVIAFAAILLNVIVDVLYAWLDPRVRLGATS